MIGRLITVAASLAAIAALGAACASAPRAPNRCPLLTSDSIYTLRGPVYRECAVDSRVRQVGRNIPADFHPSGRVRCITAEIEFVVDTTGTPEVETARVRQTNDRTFADALMLVVPRMKYEPAQLNGARVRQITTLSQKVMTIVSSSPTPPPRVTPQPTC